jgi:hypothetical protein
MNRIEYGEADGSREKSSISTAERLIYAAKKVIERLKEKEAKTPEKTSNTRISPDVKKTINAKSSFRELRDAIKREHEGKLPDKFIQIREETRKKLEDTKQQMEHVSPIFVSAVSNSTITDERTAQMALKMLEVRQAEDSAELANQIRNQAQELWRHIVGSGGKTTGAEQSRDLIWQIKSYISTNRIENLAEDDRKALDQDLELLIKTSKYPPDIEITEDLGGFKEIGEEVVTLINSRYDEMEIDMFGTASGYPKRAELLTTETANRDITELEANWNEYVKEYNNNDNDKEPPSSEKSAYQNLLGQLVERQKTLQYEEELELNRGQYREARNQGYGDEEIIRTPNQFQLNQLEAETVLYNPIAFFEKKLVRMENSILDGGFDDPTVKGEYERYQLALNFLLSEEFERQSFLKHIENADTDFLDKYNNEFNKFQKNFTDERRIFLKELSVRFKALHVLPALTNAKNFNDQNLMQVIGGLSENFFVEYPATGGGIVEDADDILTIKALELLRSKTGVDKRLTKSIINRAIEETKKEMLDVNKNKHYMDQYQTYLQGAYYQAEIGENQAPSTLGPLEDAGSVISFDEYMNAVVNRAAIHKHIWFKWDEIELRGLDPHADKLYGTKIGRYDEPRSKLAALKARRRFDNEQWGSMGLTPSLFAAHNRETALFYASHHAHDVDHEAEHMADHFIHEMNGNNLTHEQKKQRLDYLFFWNPERHAKHWENHKWEEMLNNIQKGDFRQKLVEEFRVQIGIDIADTHGLQGYSPLESTWRNEQVFRQIESVWNSLFGEKASESIFTASKVINASKEYAQKKLDHIYDAEGQFHTVIKDTARFRAHNFAEMMFEMEDETFLHWFEHAGMGDDANKMLTEMSLIVAKTNRALFRNMFEEPDKQKAARYTPIDFSLDKSRWDDKQREIYNSILTGMGYTKENDKNRVTENFSKLHSFVTSQEALKRFSNVRYERFLAYSGPRWSDDLPLIILQHPDRMKSLTNDERGKIMNLGKLLSGSNLNEKDGPIKRCYGENAQLEEKIPFFYSLVKAPEAEMKKMLQELHSANFSVHGPVEAAILQEEQQYTWEKMRQVIPGIRRSKSSDSTLYRKYSGDGRADIVWPEEAHHLQEELFGLTSHSHESIAALMHTKERLLRMATWDKMFGGKDGRVAGIMKKIYNDPYIAEEKYHEFVQYMNDNFPNLILMDKIKKYGLYLLIIIAIFTFIKATDAAKDELDFTPNSGGGSGHTPAHGHG